MIDYVTPLVGLSLLVVFPRWWLLAALSAIYAVLLLWSAFGADNNIVIFGFLGLAFQLVPIFVVIGAVIVAIRKWLKSRMQVESPDA